MKLTLASLALFPLVALASPAPAPVTRIPISRRSFTTKEGVADIDALVSHLENVRV